MFDPVSSLWCFIKVFSSVQNNIHYENVVSSLVCVCLNLEHVVSFVKPFNFDFNRYLQKNTKIASTNFLNIFFFNCTKIDRIVVDPKIIIQNNQKWINLKLWKFYVLLGLNMKFGTRKIASHSNILTHPKIHKFLSSFVLYLKK